MAGNYLQSIHVWSYKVKRPVNSQSKWRDKVLQCSKVIRWSLKAASPASACVIFCFLSAGHQSVAASVPEDSYYFYMNTFTVQDSWNQLASWWGACRCCSRVTDQACVSTIRVEAILSAQLIEVSGITMKRCVTRLRLISSLKSRSAVELFSAQE